MSTNDPELSAMQIIADTMSTLSAADQKRVARWSMPATDVEVKAQAVVLDALALLKEPQRQRVIRWTVSRFSGPASTARGGRTRQAHPAAVRSAEAAA